MLPLDTLTKALFYIAAIGTLILGFIGLFTGDTSMESSVNMIQAFVLFIILGIDEVYGEVVKVRRSLENK